MYLCTLLESESQPVPNPDIQMEFTCFLVNQKTGRNVPERRVLKFWFREGTDYFEHVTVAYEFFKELVKPDNFPRGVYMFDLDLIIIFFVYLTSTLTSTSATTLKP